MEIRTARQTDEYIGKTLCKILGLHTREHSIYSPDGVFLFLNVGYDKRKGKRNRITYTGFMLHGFSGGKRMGGKVNAAEDYGTFCCIGLYIVSHTHTKLHSPAELSCRTQGQRQFVTANSYLSPQVHLWSGWLCNKEGLGQQILAARK